jgi:hypothetical protein
MKLDQPNVTKRRTSKHNGRLRTEVPSCTKAEELYWFAMALTGNAEFAAKLVVDAGKPVSTGRGVLHA